MLTVDACGVVFAVDANPSSLVTTLGVETPSTGFNLRVKVALVRVTETLTPLKIKLKIVIAAYSHFLDATMYIIFILFV